ncbi:2Fe-2S iron-sulfur cluster binding domain-containing protein [Halapricum sp. CBA1109]|uniref:2Fe-2S iron-sulfur cluster-binding protein n=1 Tax=Halapricum sp. CBA1109 TaxID=2668068 RepID=UPI0012FA8C34|nr:2Fe-2S iron-sulfur cluster binding domain-containing protein [Halapricum sp. CBA1109]MUV89848.1 2Fe-2S iron-sulfur cluster binding domain-containing protein [Halapricum sp. CBA1109]
MPVVRFRDEEIACQEGALLRDVLLDAGCSVHNGPRAVSCHGFGTCGTCAVRVDGPVEPATPEGREAWRLDFPPHDAEDGRRLACQIRVHGDLTVEKDEGFWGQQ